MKNIIILFIFLLILTISAFLISCDDFLAPTIEIFNTTKIEQNHGQSQNQEQKKEQQQINQ